ncbi:MAG: transposase [Betaproteobacteria bacterium]|nr:transposase [Betaproteobacteria bacterium]
MSLTRKERLEELGLWPAWRRRDVAQPQVAQAPSPASMHLRQGVHERGYLPHLKAEGGIYFVTFRLADSLPAEALARLESLPVEQRSEKVNSLLDQGSGVCWLARPEIAEMVRDVLLAETVHSRLHAWVVMPNHVHALIEPLGGTTLSDVLQRTKSISAHRANQVLGLEGAFWQRETYDHLIRDQQDFNQHLEYIRMNPERAGLVAAGQAYSLFGAAHAGEGACATKANAGATGSVPNLDWDALYAAIRSCTRCPLHQSRSQAVPGVGDRHAEWLFVGEAPGAEEDRQGEPFVGQAGKLLDAMLAAIRLRRGENVFIANVLKSRPPANRDPEPAEVAACLPYLERQIELIRPKLIVALGRFAAQSLLSTDTAIGKLRGRVHAYQGVPMVVTYHPAYLLRNPADKAKVWEDLVLAVRTMDDLKRSPIT